MPRGPDVSVIVDQVKARLKQIEDQFSQHQRFVDELERLREVVVDLEHAVMPASAASNLPRASRPSSPSTRALPGPARRLRVRRGQNKAKILQR